MKSLPPKKAAERNWVAKHAQTFCKAAVHRNKKKDYIRTPKHRQRDFGVSFCTEGTGLKPSVGSSDRLSPS